MDFHVVALEPLLPLVGSEENISNFLQELNTKSYANHKVNQKVHHFSTLPSERAHGQYPKRNQECRKK
jgi:hypothetical protein